MMLRTIGTVLSPLEVLRFSVRDGKGIQKSSSYYGLVRVRSVRVLNERSEEVIGDKPTHSSFLKPLTDLYPRLPCRFCKGLGEVVCDICDGQGKFNKGGYHKKNPISVERIIGSKWTAMERTFGWRHFRVRSKRKGSGKDWFVEMSATCDESTRFWVNVQNLKERERWSMGWLQKIEILDAQNKETGSNLVCKACKGKGQQPCSCSFRDPDETILDIIESESQGRGSFSKGRNKRKGKDDEYRKVEVETKMIQVLHHAELHFFAFRLLHDYMSVVLKGASSTEKAWSENRMTTLPRANFQEKVLTR